MGGWDKLLCIKCINNKVLPYSTENYIQYPMINHNGNKYQKEENVYIHTYIYTYIYIYIYI